jgi:hypothetical protein
MLGFPVDDRNTNHIKLTSACQHIFEMRPTLLYIDARQGMDAKYDRFYPCKSIDSDVLVSNSRFDEQEVLEWRL